jgi:hypothetical protein
MKLKHHFNNNKLNITAMKAKIHESDELKLGNTVQVHKFKNALGFAITFAKIEIETEKSFFWFIRFLQ